MSVTAEPFEFMECVNILKSTGRRARNLRELRAVIENVSENAILHHTYQYFLKERVIEYTNDFAHWAGESLEERALAERLSAIDPYAFTGIWELRHELMTVIDQYLETFPEPRQAMAGDEFHFNETVTILFPAGIKANNLAEFHMAIRFLDPSVLYYHFYEARVRLGGSMNDFSMWFENTLGRASLAASVRAIDPFMLSIEEIRERITGLVEEEVKKDMEALNA
jgi:hypothetical protein